MSIARTASINVRTEPEAKIEAENVFRSIGISTSDAINIFLKQVARRQAIPFTLEADVGPKHLDASNWSNSKLGSEIKAGLDSSKQDKLCTEDEVFEEILN